MLALGRRQFFAGAGAAMFGADSPFEPEIDPIHSRDGFVVPDALGQLAGHGPVFPVWLHDNRITVSRFRQGDTKHENEPGIAILLYRELPAEGDIIAQWAAHTEHRYQLHSVRQRLLPKLVRVVDARTGEVVFTSALAESISLSAQREIDRSPFQDDVITNLRCGDGRSPLTALYRGRGGAPYEQYFGLRAIPLPLAVSFRNYLRNYSEVAALLQVLNPDFVQWFWQRVSKVPELPDPAAMCGEQRKLWTFLLGTYV